MKLGQETKQFVLDDPEKQLVSREYLTDLLNPSQTPEPHNLLFLKLFNHLAMQYKLQVIGQGEEKEWTAREEISSISASCLHTAKEKVFPSFDFQIIVYDFPLSFPRTSFFFYLSLAFIFPCSLSLYGSFTVA